MKLLSSLLVFCVILSFSTYGQSVSFSIYMNPVIPGDHPDCTLTKVGNDFYTTGSSFNPTPVIYHSTDLVHWEAIAQPVSASWSGYGDSPGGGCWGGQIVYHNSEYWDFFSRANTMYFVKAMKPEGPWSTPVKVNNPSTLPYGLGYDNSIFIDSNNKWYLVVKNGQPNNGIVELGDNGQPTGVVYNLNWINPSPSYPYSWAEGPVMWKHNGYYYYSFARDLSGGQYVMRSDTLTADASKWVIMGNFFNENDPQKNGSLFTSPNHASAVVTLDDSTYWVMHPLYAKGEWKGQGRQGLLNQVHYDASGKPVADYPINSSFLAPKLPSSGIPWMVPHTDFFNSDNLNPEWSFLGFTADNLHSLTNKPGWLYLAPKSGKMNTVIKNDGEHNYSLITRVANNPQIIDDKAGLLIMRGDEKSNVKLYSSVSGSGDRIIGFSYDTTNYEEANTAGDTVWLKIIRVNHKVTGYFSPNGFDWKQVGQSFDISAIDSYSDYSTFTGTRQGLFVQNRPAYFDLYIYRDAYSPILAECPANQLGNTRYTISRTDTTVLDNINYNNWAMYAGVEFGNDDYKINADSIKIIASSATTGGNVEVYIDSIVASTKIADCSITPTGAWNNFQIFSAKLTSKVSGNHDVYLLFNGSVMNKLFMLQSFYFTGRKTTTGINDGNTQGANYPLKFNLEQNYPNPFNPSTKIDFTLPKISNVKITVYNQLGQQITELADGEYSAGIHQLNFNASNFASGVYFYRIISGSFHQTRKMILMK